MRSDADRGLLIAIFLSLFTSGVVTIASQLSLELTTAITLVAGLSAAMLYVGVARVVRTGHVAVGWFVPLAIVIGLPYGVWAWVAVQLLPRLGPDHVWAWPLAIYA